MSLPFYKTPSGAGFVSAFLPGLGLWVRGYPNQAIRTVGIGIVLGMATWALGHWGGAGAAIFGGMLILLPWWAFQAFQASLIDPPGIRGTWQVIWKKGHDVQFLGALFFIAAVTDLYVILANPQYHLHVFCTRPKGFVGMLVKAQAPVFHVAIGYGFLGRRRWALLVYLVYAGYGLINAIVNFACEGYGRIRTVFILTLLGFTAYVILRRRCFLSRSLQQ